MACRWYAVTGLINVDADLIGCRSVERDSWNDLSDCRHTRVSQLEGRRDFVDEPPTNSKLFFLHTPYMR
jgi:hypothetical protein